ncbi:hypothetical protein C8F01DRAFT_1340935 [Mycena amicta]|nr:hypothetical protein C8F01DRAFT_1340935 [Mycena amicta]
MTAPTQATELTPLPAWLSYTTITLPQTTQTSLVFLPLTYYGPSIPLDSDWTYGGLTSPVSTLSSPSTSSIPLTSTPASTTASSSALPPSSSSALPSSTSSAVSSVNHAFLFPIPPPLPPQGLPQSIPACTIPWPAHRRHHRILFLGAFVVFLFCFSCCLRWCKRKPDQDDWQPTSGNRFTALIPRRRQRRPRTALHNAHSRHRSRLNRRIRRLTGSWSRHPRPHQRVRPNQAEVRTEVDPFLTTNAAAGGVLPNPHPANGSGNNSGSGSSRDTWRNNQQLAPTSFSIPEESHEAFDLPTHNLPPGAAPPNNNVYANIVPGRRILSPSQLAMLVEEEVLPRPSVDIDMPRQSMEGSEEAAQVVYARRVALSPPPDAPAEPPQPARRSWIPRFSWLRDSRSSRDIEDDVEAGTGLLFDASSPASPISTSPTSPVGPRLPQTKPQRPSAEMREFGARSGPILGFFSSGSSRPATPGSRPVSGALAASRPISGISSDGSGKSGGTVYTDARETLSTRGSNSRVGATTTVHDPMPDTPSRDQDPLDMPAPAAFAPFSSAASLHHSGSRTSLTHSASEASLSQTQQTLSNQASSEQPQSGSLSLMTGTTTPSASTLAGTTTSKAQPTYPFGPPGLTLSGDLDKKGSLASAASWNKNALELGFSRPASHDKLGTFGSGNRNVVQVPVTPFAAPPPPVFPLPLHGSSASANSSTSAPGIRIIGTVADRAPHLSLDLDDAPPGADGGWRLLGAGAGGSNNEWGVGVGVGVAGPGKRGTFGGPAAQYVSVSGSGGGPSSEHGSLHSRVDNASSLSSRSAHSHPTGSSSGHAHSQYPSSGSGSGAGSARSRAALGRPISVEGPMSRSPAVSAFGHHHLREQDHSGSSGHGQELSAGSLGSGLSPLPRARSQSPASPTLLTGSPWAGGLDADWRPTYS